MYIMMNIRIIKSLLSYTKDMFQSISQTLLNINTLYIVFSYASCKKLQMKHKACIRNCAVLSKGFYLRAEVVYRYVYCYPENYLLFILDPTASSSNI